jgi:hypothetical protein
MAICVPDQIRAMALIFCCDLRGHESWAKGKMGRKLDPKKSKKAESHLSAEESREMEMILDRLAVQNPEGTSLENYLKSLLKILDGRENLAAVLLEQLSRKPSKVGFQTFVVLRDMIRDKKLAKTLRQIGYRFSQRGFASERQDLPVTNVVLVQKEGRRPVAHVLPVDGTFWLFAALIPAKGSTVPTLLTALMEQDFERVYIKLAEGSQKNYRDYLRKAGERDADRKPFEVPLYHAARLFFELLDMSRGSDASAEQDQASKLLSPFHDPQKPPYAYELMPPVDDPGEHLDQVDNAALLKVLDWSWLVFPQEQLISYRHKMQELENPVLVIPNEVQEERTNDLLRRAADELCVGKTRWLYQRFFEEQALWLKLSSKEDLAWSAWIVAQHIRTEAPASDNPLVRELVTLSMHHHWPEAFQESKQKAEPFYRTESGLIVPS